MLNSDIDTDANADVKCEQNIKTDNTRKYFGNWL